MLEHKDIIDKYRKLTESVNKHATHTEARQLITDSGEVRIWAEVTKGENNHYVLIPVPRPGQLALAYANWKHIIVQARTDGNLAIGLESQDMDYLHSFARVVQDLVESCRSVHEDEKRRNALQKRLSDWHQFFREYRVKGLSLDEQCGLYGELLLLREHLIPAMGYEAGLDAWCGPDKRSKDYVNGAQAIEVKTSRLKHSDHVIHITSLHQLDDTGLDDLWLYTVSIDMESSSGETLPSIIADIKTQFKGDAVAQSKFELKLGQIGYHDSQTTLYLVNAFAVIDESAYRVEDGFPRVIGIQGIPNAKYDVDLRECIQFKQKSVDLPVNKFIRG